MKKIILTFLAFTLLFTYGFAQSKSEFLKDSRVQELQKTVFSVNYISPEDTDKIAETIKQIKTQGDALVEYYGLDNINNYIAESIKIENDSKLAGGDKCHRNANGTVNSSACSFWENISVSFQSYIGCPSPPVGAPSSWYDSQLNCIQSIICKTC
ncbi:hypothetical protein OX284_004860 [Flavobacterium sp. SUN046]|uniref:hypothetical protein n=1 Tax=Flavobacterium sp. SUN046 TaxID=3002440 RepID=UPI002DB8CD4A|nr:hypothetical protein [Flavobacterium sp. SUN046]MEC4048751.1 hypothetical protein [Flavobacterium sp. SUN046]